MLLAGTLWPDHGENVILYDPRIRPENVEERCIDAAAHLEYTFDANTQAMDFSTLGRHQSGIHWPTSVTNIIHIFDADMRM